MTTNAEARLGLSKSLMDEFAARTGLTNRDNAAERYLWTDALAVQTFFALAQALSDSAYQRLAVQLIDQVHATLGRYHPDDTHQGWLSGLPDAEARNHPTSAGLRIGKKLLERQAGEPADERLEWDRDGQYFHYLIPWAHALLAASKATEESRYADWAAELLRASARFVDTSGGRLRMYWKMSVDLSQPQVTSMGAHDPLTGFVCLQKVKEVAPYQAMELTSLEDALRQLCTGRTWATSDALGIGGLLLDTLRAGQAYPDETWPEAVLPESLLEDCVQSLEEYSQLSSRALPAHYRLAFRECGLSLGLRTCTGVRSPLVTDGADTSRLNDYLPLAERIEEFWLEPKHQKASSWTEHLNINAVSLAASLVANWHPEAFSAGTNPGAVFQR